jgi:hypothetical protein
MADVNLPKKQPAWEGPIQVNGVAVAARLINLGNDVRPDYHLEIQGTDLLGDPAWGPAPDGQLRVVLSAAFGEKSVGLKGLIDGVDAALNTAPARQVRGSISWPLKNLLDRLAALSVLGIQPEVLDEWLAGEQEMIDLTLAGPLAAAKVERDSAVAALKVAISDQAQSFADELTKTRRDAADAADIVDRAHRSALAQNALVLSDTQAKAVADLDALRASYDARLADAAAKYDARLDALRASYDARLTEQRTAAEAAAAKYAADLTEQRTAAEAAATAASLALVIAQDAAAHALAEAQAQSLAALAEQKAQAEAALIAAHDQARVDVAELHQLLTDTDAKHAAELADAETAGKDALEHLRAATDGQIATLSEQLAVYKDAEKDAEKAAADAERARLDAIHAAEEAAAKAAEEAAAKAAEEAAAEPAPVDPAHLTDAELEAATAPAPAAEPVEAVLPVAEPAAEPAAEPVAEPTAEPVEPPVEPATEPVPVEPTSVEPTTEPTTEPTAEPTAEPAPVEPVPAPSDKRILLPVDPVDPVDPVEPVDPAAQA